MKADAVAGNLLNGQVALINGAGHSLGLALANAFISAGGVVAASDPSPVLLEKSVAALRSAGGQVKAYPGELRGRRAAQSLAERVYDDWGRLDVLVNSAQARPQAAFVELDENEWQRALEVNLSAPFYLMQAAGGIMARQGGGVMLNIAVAEAIALQEDEPAAFLAGKMGLVSLTRAAARELEGDNIRVHALCPAGIADDIGEGFLPGILPDATPMIEGVVKLALYLCSPASAHLTGQILLLNAAQSDYLGNVE